MKYHIRQKENYAEGLRRIAYEFAQEAQGLALQGNQDREEAVHEVRKLCKRQRALIRLFRPYAEERYQEENACFRDASKTLSSVRDATAMIECYEQLLEAVPDSVDRRQFHPIMRELQAHRDQTAQNPEEVDDRLQAFAKTMGKAMDRIASWTFPTSGVEIVLDGFIKTYRRGRNAMEKAEAEPTVENYHDWRKRVKYHRYHLRTVRKLWKPVIKARRKEVKTLSDYLGDDHDLSVLQEFVDEHLAHRLDTDAMMHFKQIISAESDRLRSASHPLGLRVFGMKPKHLTRTLAVWDEATPLPHPNRAVN